MDEKNAERERTGSDPSLVVGALVDSRWSAGLSRCGGGGQCMSFEKLVGCLIFELSKAPKVPLKMMI